MSVADKIKDWVSGPPDADPEEDPGYDTTELTIFEHLQELRSRLTKAVLGLLVGTVIALIFFNPIADLLKRPLPPGTDLYFFTPTENFTNYVRIAVTAGVALSSWWIFWQIFQFVAPGLTRREKRMVALFLPAIAGFFILGMAFAYFAVLPFAMRYLLTFSDLAKPVIGVSQYYGFVTTILFWVGLAFETPLIIFVLAKVNLVTVERLSRYRKYAILAVFIISAIINPTPDPFTQTMVAIPLYMLYEMGILFARFA